MSKVAEARRILALAGSPRRHGNSEQLLDAAVGGAEAAGADARKMVVAEMGIEPCRGCNGCSLTGECVIRDRMREVYEELDRADALLIGSPVFFATVPAALKALYDRCQPYWARINVLKGPRPPRRPAGLLLVRGGGDPYGFRSAVEPTKSVLSVVGFAVTAELKVEGVDSPSDMGRHPDSLEEARAIGAAMAGAPGEGGPDPGLQDRIRDLRGEP